MAGLLAEKRDLPIQAGAPPTFSIRAGFGAGKSHALALAIFGGAISEAVPNLFAPPSHYWPWQQVFFGGCVIEKPFAPPSIWEAARIGGHSLAPTELGGTGTRDVITPAAEQFARQHGMLGALVAVKDAARRSVRALGLVVDVVSDPEEPDSENLLVSIVSNEPVERLVEAFEEIAQELRRDVAPEHRERLIVDFELR